jgi:Universal stress protein family
VPGIVVSVNGSAESQHALEWAATHAALEYAPLTVLAVHRVAASAWTGNSIIYPEDRTEAHRVLHAAEEAVGKIISKLGDGRPSSVTRGATGSKTPAPTGWYLSPTAMTRSTPQLARHPILGGLPGRFRVKETIAMWAYIGGVTTLAGPAVDAEPVERCRADEDDRLLVRLEERANVRDRLEPARSEDL